MAMTWLDRLRFRAAKVLLGPQADDPAMLAAFSFPGPGHRHRPAHSEIRSFPRWFRSWVYIAADKNASAVSQMHLHLYRRSPSPEPDRAGQKSLTNLQRGYLKSVMPQYVTQDTVEITEHPFLDVLARPNPLLDRCGLLWLTSCYLQIAGDAYWYLSFDGSGGIREIWPLPSQFVSPVMGKEHVFDSYELRIGHRWQVFPAMNIVHFRKPSLIDTISGFGNLRGVLEAGETNVRMEEYQRALFDNMAMPDFLLVPENDTSTEQVQRLRNDWNESYAGWRRRGQTAVAPFPLKVQELNLSHRDLQFDKGKLAVRDEICAAFGVPISVVQSDSSTYSNMKQGLALWGRHTLLPLLVHISERINMDVMPFYTPRASDGVVPDTKTPWFVAFDSPVVEDENQLVDRMVKLVQAGVYSVNMALAELGQDTVPWGDEPMVQRDLRSPSQIMAEIEQTEESRAITPETAGSLLDMSNSVFRLVEMGDLDMANLMRDRMARQLGAASMPDLDGSTLYDAKVDITGIDPVEMQKQQAAAAANSGGGSGTSEQQVPGSQTRDSSGHFVNQGGKPRKDKVKALADPEEPGPGAAVT